MRKKKNSHKDAIYDLVRLFLLLVIVLMVLKWSWSQYQSKKRAAVLLQEVDYKYQLLNDQIDSLSYRNDLLDSDTGKQDYMVNKYAVHRPGEQVMIFLDDPVQDLPEETKESDSWWDRVFNR